MPEPAPAAAATRRQQLLVGVLSPLLAVLLVVGVLYVAREAYILYQVRVMLDRIEAEASAPTPEPRP